MYGKIFDSIYKGTLYGQWEALVTFQQFIVLSDSDGVVDMTPPAIAATTSIPLEIITKGIEILENPDPYSRTPDHEGRRIVRLDDHRPWGWQIVNHQKYRDLTDYETVKEQNRERQKRYRERAKSLNDNGGNVTSRYSNAPSRHTDTDTNTKKHKGRFTPPSLQEVTDYCAERKNSVDPEAFINHYEANGWMRGKTKIKDWKACVRTWENKTKEAGRDWMDDVMRGVS